MRVRGFVVVLMFAFATWSRPEAAPPDTTVLRVSVRHAGSALHPGDIAVVVVDAPPSITGVESEALGAPLTFWAAAPGRWHALAPIPLDTTPARHELVVHGVDAGGTALAGVGALVVASKTFETRRLRVNRRFVTPPAAEAARIQRDARLLASVFADATTDRLWRGPFMPPVPGTATSSFGRLSMLNGRANGRHQGADFRAASGTPVVAPNAGRVVLAEDLYFAGTTIILDHGLGLFSLFAHLSGTEVETGTLVRRGELIGTAGSTGRVTGPHLHWAVRVGASSVDPLTLIGVTSALEDSNELLSTR